MLHHAALVVVQDREGKILVINHRGKEPYWRIPGGKVQSGETFRQAAARELLEETGLFIPADSLEHVNAQFTEVDGCDWTVHVFRAGPMSFAVDVHQARIMEPLKMDGLEFVSPAEYGRRSPSFAADLGGLL
jgi:8-oxo-dGTP pyrophosphatase MutT (NUDIX family)